MNTFVSYFPARSARKPHDRRYARLYDDEVQPLFGDRFAAMALRALAPAPGGSALEVSCATGELTVALARGLGPQGRLIAVDPSTALLDRARGKLDPHAAVALDAARVFFRAHEIGTRLPFAEESFDRVIAHLPTPEATPPSSVLPDFARVLRPGGQLVLTTPLRGTWGELHDVFKEVLIAGAHQDALLRLEAHLSATPDAETWQAAVEAAGFGEVRAERDTWELLFRSGREFFFSPAVEQGPLPRWKEIAGRGEEMQHTFLAIKNAIDTYFAGRAFPITVLGGCVSGKKPG